jgi:ribosome maturation protein Sdo1
MLTGKKCIDSMADLKFTDKEVKEAKQQIDRVIKALQKFKNA